MSKKIVVLPGDGIGPEVTSSAVAVLNALTNDVEMINGDVGYECFKRTGQGLPRSTMEMLEDCDAVLLGGITMPSNNPLFRNPIIDIKKRLDLFAEVRMIKQIVPDLGVLPDINAIFIKESDASRFNVSELNEIDGVTLSKKSNFSDVKRLFQYSRMFMEKNGRDHITCCHQVDIYPLTDSLFVNTFREVMEDAKFKYDDLKAEDLIPKIVRDPRSIDTVVSSNPYNDIVSESTASLAGGTQLVPTGVIGDRCALFKPLHNTNPNMEGLNIVNPTAMLLSTSMMLRYLGLKKESNILIDSIRSAYKRGYRTPDVGGDTGTYDFTTQVVKICENPQ